MTGNTFYNNSGTNKWQGQIFLAGKPGGRQINDWETDQAYYLYTAGTVMTGNVLQDTKAGQFVFATFLSGSDWTRFADSLSSNNNHWYDGSTKKAFKIPNGKVVDLASWQLETRADLASYWGTVTSAAASCSVPSSLYTDFSVNSDNYAYTMSGGKAVVNLLREFVWLWRSLFGSLWRSCRGDGPLFSIQPGERRNTVNAHILNSRCYSDRAYYDLC